jgi:hypothetical protein
VTLDGILAKEQAMLKALANLKAKITQFGFCDVYNLITCDDMV